MAPVVIAPPAVAATEVPTNGALAEAAQGESTNADLTVQFPVDESKSLPQTDPDDLRASLVRDAVLTFNDLAGQPTAAGPLSLTVGAATFAAAYTPWPGWGGPWVELDGGVQGERIAPDLADHVAGRDDASDTNHLAALQESRQALLRARPDAKTCPELMWVMDGRMDIAAGAATSKAAEDGVCAQGDVADHRPEVHDSRLDPLAGLDIDPNILERSSTASVRWDVHVAEILGPGCPWSPLVFTGRP